MTPGGSSDRLSAVSTALRSAVHPWLAPVAAAAGLIVMFVSVLTVPLSAAENMSLSDRETVGWIMAGYGVPGLLTIVMVARFRQPLFVTCNMFLLIFVASLGSAFPWPELVGAAMAAGVVVLVLGGFGVVGWVSQWLPAPIVHGVLAGAILHFFVDMFTAAGEEPLIVGVTLLVYVAARRFLEPHIPALLPALATGVLLAVVRGETGSMPTNVELLPTWVRPELSLSALLTVTPVVVVLITVQANVPSAVYLRRQGYDPPERLMNAVSGVGSTVTSVFGPIGISLSLPATALVAGPDAGELRRRHVAAYIAGVASVAVGLAAGFAAAVVDALPRPLLLAFVGLAVVGVLGASLHSVLTGPLLLGPLFAFGISQSDLELGGLGPFFWALAGGLIVSAVLERDAWHRLPAAATVEVAPDP